VGVPTRTDRPIGSPPSGFARRERERTSPAQEPIPPGGDGRSSGRASRPQPQLIGVGAGAAAGGELAIVLEDVAGARLLVSDVRVALLLLDEARYGVVERLFWVPRDQSWPVTLIALALIAHPAHDKSDQTFRGPGGPTLSGVALGAAAALPPQSPPGPCGTRSAGAAEVSSWAQRIRPGRARRRQACRHAQGAGSTGRSPSPALATLRGSSIQTVSSPTSMTSARPPGSTGSARSSHYQR
jgi:hypothetical protein